MEHFVNVGLQCFGQKLYKLKEKPSKSKGELMKNSYVKKLMEDTNKLVNSTLDEMRCLLNIL